MSALRALLFDLDGTLVQTRNSSWQVFQETNSKFGLGIDSASEFFGLFNENFFDALEALARDRGITDSALVREHFQQKLRSDYLPEIVPGIATIVRELASSYTLMIVSSNTMESVRRVLDNNGLADCFAHVFSGEVAPSKIGAINRVLEDPTYACGRQCVPYYDESAAPYKHAVDEMMLITDTVGDVEEARKAGIRACGVAWGMHGADRLAEAGAEFVCIWPEELLVYLRDGRSAERGACGTESAETGSWVTDGAGVRRAASEAAARRRARRAGALARGPRADSASQGRPDASGAAGGVPGSGVSCDCSEGVGEDGCGDLQTPAGLGRSGIGGAGHKQERSATLLRGALELIGD